MCKLLQLWFTGHIAHSLSEVIMTSWYEYCEMQKTRHFNDIKAERGQ